jgi:hypothetical protein
MMKMKHAMVAVLAAGIGLTAAAGPAVGAPKIKFDRLVYDFGIVSGVEEVEGKFVFENEGDALLEISRPRPTCGCTVAGLNPDKLPPGEKGELNFTLRLSPTDRKLEKYINVPTNDPENPNVRLTVRAEVKPIFDVDPPTVPLGDLRLGATTNIVVNVQRLDGKELRIERAEGGSMTTAQVETVTDSNGKQARILIQMTASAPPRRFGETIRVFTNDESLPQPSFSIPVNGRVLGDVSVSPEVLFWGIADARNWANMNERVTTRTVRVVSLTDGAKLELDTPEVSLESLTVEVVAVEEGKRYDVVARLLEPPARSVQGTIKIQTNLDSQPTLIIPVRINVIAGR